MKKENMEEMLKMNIYERLNNAQVQLKAPKGQYNKFAKFKYRSAEDILEAVKPINQRHELNLKLSDKPVMVGDRIYIEATAELTNVSNPEEKIIVTAYAREALTKKGMDDSQISGTASSYARKYALNGLYLIDDTKDSDTNEYKEQIDSAPEVEYVTAEQAQILEMSIGKLAEVIGEDDSQEKLFHWTTSKFSESKKLQDVPAENYEKAKDALTRMYNKNVEKKLEKDTEQNDAEQANLLQGNTTTLSREHILHEQTEMDRME